MEVPTENVDLVRSSATPGFNSGLIIGRTHSPQKIPFGNLIFLKTFCVLVFAITPHIGGIPASALRAFRSTLFN